MVCVDTNLWIYLFTDQDDKKGKIVRELIAPLSTKGIIISNQIFKEIAKVLSVNTNLNKDQTIQVLSRIEKLTIIRPETQNDIKLAVEIRNRYNLQFFDSVIVAFCLNNNIKTLLTEDKFIEKVVWNDKELVLINPFEDFKI